MRRQIEKPSDQPMRFFTPELYLRFNSTDAKIADRADEEWEKAIREYHGLLLTIRDKMPRQVARLTELSLHDADLLACDFDFEPVSALPAEQSGASPFWLANAILSLRHENKIVTLIYILWDRIREHPAASDWPFSKLQKHWLYDEIDAPTDFQGRFLHRILFSDGSVIEVPFISVMIHNIPSHLAGDESRKSA
jgi:hypothetical protein